MSEMSKKARAANRAKANRLAGGSNDPHKQVDASSWKPNENLNADKKTGARPIRARIYKAGGKIQGDRGPIRADKTPRGGKASGGKISDDNKKLAVRLGGDRKVLNVDTAYGRPKVKTREEKASGGALTVHDTAKENEEKLGSYHVGGYKGGGKARRHRDMGGPMSMPPGAGPAGGGVPQNRMTFAPTGKNLVGMKKGGQTKAERYCAGGMVEGGRKGRASGGRLSGDHFEGLKKAINAKGGIKQGASMRDRWDALHNSGYSTKPLYDAGLNDDHIDTALRSIAGSNDGRSGRKSGGRAKGKTNINIIIGKGGSDQPQLPPQGVVRPPAPPPMPPPNVPPGMPPGSPPPGLAGAGGPPPGMPPPMPRRRGGSTYKDMSAGAQSGLGRLEKADIQAHKR